MALTNMDTTKHAQRLPNSQATRPSKSSPHLKLVQYRPPGGEPHACAAIWRKGKYVRLASPLLRTRDGLRDPKAYVRQFPDSLASLDTFEETMSWLDAVCYAATDPREVEAACREHPEWQLSCIRYDGGDSSLLELGGLIRAAERGARLPKPLVRDCLLELIKQILKHDPTLVDAKLDATLDQEDDIATLEIGLDRVVRVTLLPDVEPNDVDRRAKLAHHRMMAVRNGWMQCLLVVPSLDIQEPMFITPRVVVVAVDSRQIWSSLARMAQRRVSDRHVAI